MPTTSCRFRLGMAPVYSGVVAIVLLGIFVACDSKPRRRIPPTPIREASSIELPAPSLGGEALVALHGCAACHTTPAHVGARLDAIAAPSLDDIGARVTASWMRRYLSSPHDVHSDTRMPDVLARVAPSDRADLVENLVHYLQSRGGPFRSDEVSALAGDLESGRVAFDTVGCRACHDDSLRTRLRDKTSVSALAGFLLDPLRHRPSGRMPDMMSDATEARALALHLLRDQAIDRGEPQVRAGLVVDVYEGDFDFDDPHLRGPRVVETKVATRIGIEPRRRDDKFGLRFRGAVRIPRDGRYTFFTNSDDGSWLWIDGQMVVENGGLHGNRERSGDVELEAGLHQIMVTMFENGGDEGLSVSLSGPELRKQEIPVDMLVHRPLVFGGTTSTFRLDHRRVSAGEQLFGALGCARCHDPKARTVDLSIGSPPALADLVGSLEGCLAPEGAEGLGVRHALTSAERVAIGRFLKSVDELESATREPTDEVDHVFATLDCGRCHHRDGVGGPRDEDRSWFVGTAELGDEGRIPPDLTGVGRKLRPDWMREVLVNGGSVRPYMLTRMPQFGEAQVGHLPATLASADGATLDTPIPAWSPASGEAGRTLLGREGFSCVSCHFFGGHGDDRHHAVDIADATKRLRFDWFCRLLEDPGTVSPGTRMPPYWADGKIEFPDILDGDPKSQREAMWMFLSRADSLPLPTGLVYDRAQYDLVPTRRPLIFGTFMRDLSARVTCVGFPERVHYAFDAAHVRLAKTWFGGFMNAQGTWHDRAGKLEQPESVDVVDLPAGPAFHRGADAWPKSSGRRSAWRMVAQRRETDGAPTFVYRRDDIVVEETPRPIGNGVKGLRRSFRVQLDKSRGEVWHRAATGASIISMGEGRYDVDDRLRVRVIGAPARVRTEYGLCELLVEIGDDVQVEVTW